MPGPIVSFQKLFLYCSTAHQSTAPRVMEAETAAEVATSTVSISHIGGQGCRQGQG